MTSFAFHVAAEFEQVVHQETSNPVKKKNEPEKPKAAKLKKLEEETVRLPAKREYGKEEKQNCKIFLSNPKDEKRRCWTCGSPDHMSPACARPKREGRAFTTQAESPEDRGYISKEFKREGGQQDAQELGFGHCDFYFLYDLFS